MFLGLLRQCNFAQAQNQTEILSLPWHNKDHMNLQGIQQPTVIETSKWTKMTLGKACKAFGINSVGFEHELLDLILRMEQKRLEQSRKKGTPDSRSKSGKSGKRKGQAEIQKLICDINYDGGNKFERGRQCKIISR